MNELPVMAKDRNQYVDIMRGIAMLLVVLGHTMTGCTAGAKDSFLYNMIWTIQMPMFILISGYITRYSRRLNNITEFKKYVKRRTIAYVLPWIVWSILVRGIIFGQYAFLNIKWLLVHMDTGYWFLATIWTISIIFGISTFISESISKITNDKRILITLLIFIVCMFFLACFGLMVGLSFFAIKLTLYYMPFYITGFLYGQYQDRILEAKWGELVIDIVIGICLAVWLFIIKRYNVYSFPDNNGLAILLRVLVSMAGCFVVCGLFKGLFSNKPLNNIGSLFHWCGLNSLEIYLSHYLFLCLLKTLKVPMTGSIQGVGLIAINYIITVMLTVFVIKAVSTNKTLRIVLFGNKR